MKLFEEYVAHALAFDRLAAEQSDPEIRVELAAGGRLPKARC
jgi:hypothetical protein